MASLFVLVVSAFLAGVPHPPHPPQAGVVLSQAAPTPLSSVSVVHRFFLCGLAVTPLSALPPRSPSFVAFAVDDSLQCGRGRIRCGSWRGVRQGRHRGCVSGVRAWEGGGHQGRRVSAKLPSAGGLGGFCSCSELVCLCLPFVAVCRLYLRDGLRPEMASAELINREVELLGRVPRHPNIVRLRG